MPDKLLVYVAGSLNALSQCKKVYHGLREEFEHLDVAGGDSNWMWNMGRENLTIVPEDSEFGSRAQDDFDHVDECDVLIQVCPTIPSTGGGCHTELGLALAWQKPIFVLSTHRTNIFHWLPDVTFCRTFEGLKSAVSDVYYGTIGAPV